jgi:isochorismate synthase
MIFLRKALDRPFGDGEVRVITVPAPETDPEPLLDLMPGEPGVFWAPSSGSRAAGVGAIACLTGAGPDRLADVATAASALWPRLQVLSHPGVAPVPVRLYGGLSFLAEPPTAAWAAFGQAAFMLPRLTYLCNGDGGRMALTLTAADRDRLGVEALVRSVTDALDHVTGEDGEGIHEPLPLERADAGSALSSWTRAVESIRASIADGQAEKIVAARSREVTFAGPVDPVPILRRLAAEGAASRFGFRFGTATFVGATPERLVSRRGLEVWTEALAGSAMAGSAAGEAGHARDGGVANGLRSSAKDREEHGYVVEAIAGALGPLCSRLDHPGTPEVRRLRHVLHLRTPFEGTLSRPVPVLELVHRLHPTPAVGGLPVDRAMDWITREENLERGWYAAPVGWFDAAGDGEFVVALRSALLEGNRATVYAGAGIVAASDATAELVETELKMRTMLEALGATR